MQNILGGGITRNKSPEEGKQKWIQLNLLAERKSETELELYAGAIWKDSARQVQAVPLICETESLLLALKRQGTASCILGSSLCQCIQNWKATSRELWSHCNHPEKGERGLTCGSERNEKKGPMTKGIQNLKWVLRCGGGEWSKSRRTPKF